MVNISSRRTKECSVSPSVHEPESETVMEAKLRDYRERKNKVEPPGKLDLAKQWILETVLSASNKVTETFT